MRRQTYSSLSIQRDDANNQIRYSDGTPNGHKISVTLEELGVKYTAHHIDISKNTQKEDWFLKINRMIPFPRNDR